ncbi:MULTISPECIES: purine-nucleoside phosphorylase [Treponema]|uniref:Uridine phosphorylase n=1 Tax=Treponema rectale TaxID=744512 RepID=A0A840SAN9_9SPIR|nr:MULTISPECIES: purine-nucleoside phosphorylase [Treponema]MBB5219769.1 purine-nucleoside phosphorylase [Treponema rectale]MBE6354391.1 purine-nucleoside phosphorylase [Treponema sp.]MBO6177194.1 purine-nucleoside phosphorylase [Treponema sp.]
MSTHINAPEGAIADSVLLPGDPLRAKFIAENFLTDAKCYNEVRGMYGFTGTYKGKKVSVQGTGMGQPSLSIYVNELFQFYGVQKAIRVGTCGAVRKDIALREVILAQGACSDSGLNTMRFNGLHYAPIADFDLLKNAYEASVAKGLKTNVGNIVSSDMFYDPKSNWKLWAEYGAMGVEMEAAELYTLAAKFNRKALAVLTVSDHILLGGETTAEERQTTFTNMIEIALEAITK